MSSVGSCLGSGNGRVGPKDDAEDQAGDENDDGQF